MSDHSKIEWTDATWNPVIGCTKVSPGCDHCYAIRTAHRMQANPNPKIAAAYAGTEAGGDWTGVVNELEERLDQPLRWRRPRRIFVNSQSDLFHDDVDDWFIAKVFAVMALAPQHTFQVLTKRHGRMRSLLSTDLYDLMVRALGNPDLDWDGAPISWPLPNVWLGVSVEDQKRCDLRVPALQDTPAAVRFLSCEPLLGPVDVINSIGDSWLTGIDWIIAGGESGPGARLMHPEWVRSLRDQCEVAGVAFHFKQWGEWAPVPAGDLCGTHAPCGFLTDEGGASYFSQRHQPGVVHMARVGKHAAGRELDGRTWDEYPEAVTQ